MWSIYTETAVGQQFLASGNTIATLLQGLANHPPISTSLEPTQEILELDHGGAAIFISMPSITILLLGCMKIIEQIIPDAGMMLSFVLNKIRDLN